MSNISEFSGKYHFLSNFHPSAVEMDGKVYPTVEHAYQAAKTLDMDDREVIRSSPTPGMAKKLAKHVNLRKGWIEDGLRDVVMAELIWKKFSTNPILAKKLLDTADSILIEGNHWNDRYWGVCKGAGKNMLGQILMEVRKRLGEINEHSST